MSEWVSDWASEWTRRTTRYDISSATLDWSVLLPPELWKRKKKNSGREKSCLTAPEHYLLARSLTQSTCLQISVATCSFVTASAPSTGDFVERTSAKRHVWQASARVQLSSCLSLLKEYYTTKYYISLLLFICFWCMSFSHILSYKNTNLTHTIICYVVYRM